MRNFELPSNIRQIGNIAEGVKIYVEDYVNTYLKQYADAGGHSERIAFLIGKEMVIDKQRYVFISGMVQGKYGELDEGSEVFSEQSYAYCEEQLSAYFRDCEIVGWMQSQPGYGVTLHPAVADYHMMQFMKPYQLLFVMDPAERTSTFYTWTEGQSGIAETPGYYIYYDKNPGMQAYMAHNKLAVPRAAEPVAHEKANRSARTAENPPMRAGKERLEDITREVQPPREFRRLLHTLVTLSAVLFVVCAIMGAGLLRSDGRIARLEKDLSSLNSTYSYLLSQVKTLSVQSVFAGQDSEPSGDNVSVVPTNAAEQTAQPNEADVTQAAHTPPPATQETTVPPVSTPTTAPEQTPAPTIEPTLAPTQTAEVSEVAYDLYTVQQGDNLLHISIEFYGTANMVGPIMELNGLTDPDKIFFGKVLKLPK